MNFKKNNEVHRKIIYNKHYNITYKKKICQIYFHVDFNYILKQNLIISQLIFCFKINENKIKIKN